MTGSQFMDLLGALVVSAGPAFFLIFCGVTKWKAEKPESMLFGEQNLDLSTIQDVQKFNHACGRWELGFGTFFSICAVCSFWNPSVLTLVSVILLIIGILLMRSVYRKIYKRYSLPLAIGADAQDAPKKEISVIRSIIRELAPYFKAKQKRTEDEKKADQYQLYDILNQSLFQTGKDMVLKTGKALFPKIKIPLLSVSDRYYWLCCALLTTAVYGLGIVIYGEWNLFDMLVDVPAFSYLSFASEMPGELYVDYLGLSIAVSTAAITLLKCTLLGKKEYSFFSVNGFFYWLLTYFISLLLGSLALDLVTAYASINAEGSNVVLYIFFMLIVAICLCFAINESVVGLLAIWISMPLFYIVTSDPFVTQVIPSSFLQALLLTNVMRILLDLLERIKILSAVKWLINKLTTPKIFAFLLFCVLLPIIVVGKLLHLL